MGRLGEQVYRRKLHRYLSRANDLEFIRMLWAIDALQSGRSRHAARYLNFPKEAATDDITNRLAIYKWELEVLANELLTVPKEARHSPRVLTLDCSQFATAIEVVRTLRKLENAEYSDRKVSILKEMHRIGQRQFEWQRGFYNRSEFYRGGRVFGGPEVDKHFRRSHGLSFQQFTKFGFVVHGTLLSHPGIDPRLDMTEIGIDNLTRDRGFDLIWKPLGEARSTARTIRSPNLETAYRPSILRRWPLIEFVRGELAMCPALSLVAQRVSTGVFYDLLGASGEVWDEIGERFENFARDLLSATMTSRNVVGETRYRIGKDLLHTPDIIVSKGDKTELVIECKAKRMTFEAKFETDPVASAAKGYNEMARAVVQIWRYVRDWRSGKAPGSDPSEAFGLVLTLDNWLASSKELQEEVLQRADSLADSDRRGIEQISRIPIAFTSVQDLDMALAGGCDDSLIRTIGGLTEEYRGWLLPLAQKHFGGGKAKARDVPLGNNLGEVFEWWDELETPPGKGRPVRN